MRILVALTVVATSVRAFASEPIQLDPPPQPVERATAIRALLIGEMSQRFCPLRLAPNGAVQGAQACQLGDELKHVRSWRRNATAIFFDNADGEPLLAFQAIGRDSFRAVDAMPESLLLRLLPMPSVHMSR